MIGKRSFGFVMFVLGILFLAGITFIAIVGLSGAAAGGNGGAQQIITSVNSILGDIQGLFTSGAFLSAVASFVTITSGTVGLLSYVQHLRQKETADFQNQTKPSKPLAPAEPEDADTGESGTYRTPSVTGNPYDVVQEGLAALKSGDKFGAIEHFRRATTLTPLYPKAFSNLAAALYNVGKAEEALPYIQQVNEILEPGKAMHLAWIIHGAP